MVGNFGKPLSSKTLFYSPATDFYEDPTKYLVLLAENFT